MKFETLVELLEMAALFEDEPLYEVVHDLLIEIVTAEKIAFRIRNLGDKEYVN